MTNHGFTLIEIMVVVVIIGLIASLVTPNIWSSAREAERRIALATCNQYHGAVKMWMLHNRLAVPPRSLEELEQPLPNGEEDFLRVQPDPWGGPYRIAGEGGRRFRIASNGPDGQEGTGDDVHWEPLDD